MSGEGRGGLLPCWSGAQHTAIYPSLLPASPVAELTPLQKQQRDQGEPSPRFLGLLKRVL